MNAPVNAPVPNPSEGPGWQRTLGVYLNDHLAGATGGTELVHRMVQEHGDSAYGPELRSLATEISQDRQALLRLMADLNVPTRRYKVYGAWLGEKLARVKPNGRLVRRSGLTVLIELETIRTGAGGKSMLWRTLLSASAEDPRLDSARLEELLRRAERQIKALDSLHARAASALFSPAASPRSTPAHVAGGKPSTGRG
ncbi:hypothetical protein [Streptomyces sp. NBC_00847]|uniref:hypothetical protein n=1 Tax=unclassified Streptomyces TaxID=2593676 RepID=UPI00225E1DED|nr:hypothetical protein [Streptomyces sp. NBC_00847]MCX4885550.1 hypothetical protein [Streptomyces sp. NBC_00847]